MQEQMIALSSSIRTTGDGRIRRVNTVTIIIRKCAKCGNYYLVQKTASTEHGIRGKHIYQNVPKALQAAYALLPNIWPYEEQ